MSGVVAVHEPRTGYPVSYPSWAAWRKRRVEVAEGMDWCSCVQCAGQGYIVSFKHAARFPCSACLGIGQVAS